MTAAQLCPLRDGRLSVIMRDMVDAPDSISAIFNRHAVEFARQRALGFILRGELHWRTWNEVAEDRAQKAAVLRTAGLRPGDRVAHISENRYEWIITDLAIQLAGGVHVPLHVTLSAEQMAAQIADCGARFLVVSSRALFANLKPRVDPNTHIWVHDEQGVSKSETLLDQPAVTPDQSPVPSPQSPVPSPQSQVPSPQPQAPDPSALATILYTSGTTGLPRGVMLSHRNLTSNAAAVAEAYGGGNDQTRLCILPLSHIYARTCDLYTWICSGSRLILGERRETLARDLQLAQPTSLNAVPFIYQRIADQIRASRCRDEAAALRAFFGGRIERLICGGAPLASDVEAWYADCGLPIHCGYGLTEASPVISVTPPGGHRFGSVGRPLANVEVRITADGEVLARGPNVMMGYWNGQGEVAHTDAIQDGWLQTGDLGEIDADGYLFICGRKKELIVLSTGKNVFPTRIENLLCASPLIEQAAIFGEGQPSLGALIVPAHPAADVDQREFAAEVERCLRGAAKEEQVRGFVLLDRPFSIDRGEMTPKQSLCRAVIARNFAAELQSLWR